MLKFNVDDMSCNHCVASITNALKAAAPGATVHIDLDARRVDVDGAANPDAVLNAITGAGFTASRIQD